MSRGRNWKGQASSLVARTRTGADATARIEAGQALPGDEDRAKAGLDAERQLAKRGVDIEAARRGVLIQPGQRASKRNPDCKAIHRGNLASRRAMASDLVAGLTPRTVVGA